ncbi:hypothetical protein MLD38_022411 [Melastoma candidum]|nr:hypothetical protein MLD38_022411 [Melastoma candidum]
MATPKQLGITVSGDDGKAGKTAFKGQDENEDIDVHSEMHEDTEELNALLYSDEESDYSCEGDGDDDEVTSTGHSPSTMTGHWDHGFGPSKKVPEEVARSLPSKKRKLSNECRNLPPSADSYEAENPIGNFNGDDAISSSGNCNAVSQNRGIKRARIRETISILESLVPGVKRKNPVEVLDEAIEYLKSLKQRASRAPSQGRSKVGGSKWVC